MTNKTNQTEQVRRPVNIHYEAGRRGEAVLAKTMATFPNNHLQESVFVKDFLPALVAGNELPPSTGWPNAWIAVAGSVHAEVDIYRGDEYLFTTPPLYREIAAEVNRTETPQPSAAGTPRSSWSNLAYDYQDAQFPDRVGAQMLNKIEEHGFVCSAADHLAAWDKVFLRYGLDYRIIRREVHKHYTGEDVNVDNFGISSESNNSIKMNVEVVENGDVEEY
ncbi:hypothetical protein ABN214_15410 [Proteus terrae]|uniref:hypothetical protein n=1 Tax=Proteus terrae TaxID=1574161 RepID=UPI0032DBB713